MPDEQVTWMMHMMTSYSFEPTKLNPREFNSALSNESYQATQRDFYSAYDGYIFGDWQSLVRHSLKPSP